MAWLIVLMGCAAGLAAALWKMQQLKKEIGLFAERVERNLDRLVRGEELEEVDGTKDTLWGKTGEKLRRADHIWRQKEAESALEKSRVKELISDVSHQTKTPIANIKVYAELLHEEQLTDSGQEFLENLEEQTEKLDFLLQSMVKMSRLETGIIHIQSQKTNFYETLKKAVAAIVPRASEKEITLHVECEEELAICHDSRWTQEAVFNVLDNAVKYTGQGGSIHVRAVRQEIFTKISIRESDLACI